MPGTFTYQPESVASEARYWIRFRLGARQEDRSQVDDEEIDAILGNHGLTATSDPDDNWAPIRLALRDCCRALAASLGYDSQTAVDTISPPKRSAAEFFLELAKIAEREAMTPTLERKEPVEELDSMDYVLDRFGGDASEFVGDPI